MQDALRAAREALGPGALVLSTRMVAAPGVRGLFGARVVEITAAAERPEVSDLRQSTPDDGLAVGAATVAIHSIGEVVTARARERQDAHARAKSRTSPNNGDRSVASLAAQLEATGLDAVLAHQVAAAHPQTRRRGATVHNLRTTLA